MQKKCKFWSRKNRLQFSRSQCRDKKPRLYITHKNCKIYATILIIFCPCTIFLYLLEIDNNFLLLFYVRMFIKFASTLTTSNLRLASSDLFTILVIIFFVVRAKIRFRIEENSLFKPFKLRISGHINSITLPFRRKFFGRATVRQFFSKCI